MTSPRNELEVQILGLQRSGNHAIVTWLLQQSREPVVFLNNVAHYQDPFLHFRFAAIPNAVPLHHSKNADTRRFELLRVTRKNLLVIGYENLNLASLRRRELIKRDWVGESRRIRRVLLLRDFYNWLASRIRLFENKKQVSDGFADVIKFYARLWLIYAREFAGQTDFLGDGLVRIQFGKWCDNDTYREELLREIGLPVLNNARDKIADVGGGSSFDELLHADRASCMPLTTRWQYLLSKEYAWVHEVISSHEAEIEELNSQIFGVSKPF